MKKKEMLKQRSSQNPSIVSNASNTNNSTRNPNTDNNETRSQESSSSSMQPTVLAQLPKIDPTPVTTNAQSSVFNASEKGINQIKKGSESNNEPPVTLSTALSVNGSDEKSEVKLETDENKASPVANATNQNNLKNLINKHVDFKLNEMQIVNSDSSKPQIENDKTEGEDEEEEHDEDEDGSNATNTSENGHCRLRRRDTPHHLKGARVNTSNNKAQQLDPSEMKEILERYTNMSTAVSPVSGKFTSTNALHTTFVKPKV